MQITDYLGKHVKVTRKDNTIVVGKLVFFNFNKNVIHLAEYKITSIDGRGCSVIQRQGSFIIVNDEEWTNLEANGGK